MTIYRDNDKYVTTCQHNTILRVSWLEFFFLSSLVTESSFISISSPVLKLWQCSFIRDWFEVQKSEISQFEFFLISGDWHSYGYQIKEQIFLMKCYWKLQNARVIGFMVSELLRKALPQPHHTDWFSSNSAYLNHSKLNPLSLSEDFAFLDQICLTTKSLILKTKFEHSHQIQHVGTNLST